MSMFREQDILPVIFMIKEIALFWWITCKSAKRAIKMQIAENDVYNIKFHNNIPSLYGV